MALEYVPVGDQLGVSRLDRLGRSLPDLITLVRLADKQRREIAESVVSGHKSGAEMARLYGLSEPTVSRIVAAYRQQQG